MWSPVCVPCVYLLVYSIYFYRFILNVWTFCGKKKKEEDVWIPPYFLRLKFQPIGYLFMRHFPQCLIVSSSSLSSTRFFFFFIGTSVSFLPLGSTGSRIREEAKPGSGSGFPPSEKRIRRDTVVAAVCLVVVRPTSKRSFPPFPE